MTDFRTIEIDFDIHKLIEANRRSFRDSANDVLRHLLKLGEPAPIETGARAGRPWTGEGATLPHGTIVRMSYNGRLHEGQIIDGKWVVEKETFDSPSGAASGVAVTRKGKRTKLDGWIYWKVKRPGDANWVELSNLRRVLTADDL
jgi:hypothetical protein